MSAAEPRIAILGMHQETNRFVKITGEADFRAACYFEGEAILAEARRPAPAMPAEIPAFLEAMDRTGPWQPVPILLTSTEPGGPVEQGFFDACIGKMQASLKAAGPLDGVYISNHGAMATTGSHDPDGDIYAMTRALVGSGIPIVATLDLHANISQRMVASVDAIIAYRTNPHIDQRERAVEAAALLRRLMAGERLAKAFIRLPIIPPPLKLVTASGLYGELIAEGERAIGPDIALVSVVGGFFRGDLPKAGLAIIAYGRGRHPDELAQRLAARAWAERERFAQSLTPLDTAIAMAVANGESATGPTILLADVADNPGSGGPGNTTDILEGLIRAKAERVLMGNFVDAAVAAQCHKRGVGARFDAAFNTANADRFARHLKLRLEVLALSEGPVIGRRGIAEGRTVNLGPSAAILGGGLTMVVVSRRIQCADPIYFETFGLKIAEFRTLVVKSLAHFRAGFDEFVTPENIHEVDAGGMTTPVQSRYKYKYLPRPIYPLDLDMVWTPPTI